MTKQLLKYHKWYLLYFFLHLQLIGISQEVNPIFSNTTYDYHILNDWYLTPAVFTLTNNTPEPIAIIKKNYPQHIQIEIPKNYIPSGASSEIKIYYRPSKIGTFKEKIPIYFSHLSSPIFLTIQGEIQTNEPCPSFVNNTGTDKSFYLQDILVIDKITQTPISGAEITVLLNRQPYAKGKSFTNGIFRKQLKPNPYDIQVEKTGYEPFSTTQYFKRNMPPYLVYLTPIQEKKEDPIPSKEDPPQEQPKFAMPLSAYKENNIVLLLDISISMRKNKKMEDLKRQIKTLVSALRKEDKLSILVFNTKSKLLIEGVAGNQQTIILPLIDSLTPFGMTEGIAGLKQGYDIARKQFIEGGNNQLIIATDGEFETPEFSERELTTLLKTKADEGIILSVMGFGEEEKAIKRMEKMAKNGLGGLVLIAPNNNDDGLLEEIKLRARK